MTQWVCGINLTIPDLTPWWPLWVHGIANNPPLLIRIVSGISWVWIFYRSWAVVSGTSKHWTLPSTRFPVNSFFIPYSVLLNVLQCLLIERRRESKFCSSAYKALSYIFTISCLFPTYSVLWMAQSQSYVLYMLCLSILLLLPMLCPH